MPLPVKDKISGKKKNMKVICVDQPALLQSQKVCWPTTTATLPAWHRYVLCIHWDNFIPAPLHAGGLRYHGMAPIVSHLVKLGLIEAKAVPQLATFEAGIQFARTEGYISAPETNHAIRVTIDEALKCREEGKSKVILLAHSGHGYFDMGAYDAYLSGKLEDFEYPEAKIKEALTQLPQIPVK